MDQPAFLHYSQAELDACYDQRVWARDAEAAIRLLGTSSSEARRVTPHRADLAYGPSADERLDWFPAAAPGAPIHIHLHGGAWRNLTKADASFAAPAFVAAGIHHVVPNFSKLPNVRLPDMVDQVARAVAYVYRTASDEGADAGRVLLSGHSSGGHLAAVLLTLDWSAYGVPADIIKAGLCVAGTYDLEPVLLSARGSYIALAPDEMRRLSPLRHVDAIGCPVTIVSGGRESPEFMRQAKAFATALREAGKAATLVDMPGADHFDVNAAFGQAGSPVHAAALGLIAAMPKATP